MKGKLLVVAVLAGVAVLTGNADASSFGSFSSDKHNIEHPASSSKKPKPADQHQPAHQEPAQKAQTNPGPKPAAATAVPSTEATKLKADVSALNSTLDKYIKAGNKADLDLTVIITGIDLVAIMNTDLTNIDQDSALVRDLLGIAKQVPELKDQASMLLTALERAKPSVKQAQKATSEANASLMPIRNKLNTVDKGIRTLVSTAGTLEKTLSNLQCRAGEG